MESNFTDAKLGHNQVAAIIRISIGGSTFNDWGPIIYHFAESCDGVYSNVDDLMKEWKQVLDSIRVLGSMMLPRAEPGFGPP